MNDLMDVRFLIVKGVHDDKSHPYEGMDRPPLGAFPDISEPLILQGVALEDLSGLTAETSYRNFMVTMAQAGVADYELLALGDVSSDGWEFLGFDVGETTPAAWSAIAHRSTFLSSEEQDKWEERLNSHGLFDERSDAQAYLARYIASDDPDKGWTEEGWTDEPDIYTAVPIYRHQPLTEPEKTRPAKER